MLNMSATLWKQLLRTAEDRFGISRDRIAAETMFVSHETYTPARGGSAAAEIHALRDVFGDQANRVIIANTKGFTGHTMGVGVEDVVAVKALEFGIVPPIANIQNGFEPDLELGDLNLSHGGKYPVEYSLRLGAGFGSQIAMTLLRKIPGQGERVDKFAYGRWLSAVSGYEATELEVSQRTLRIKNQGVPVKLNSASTWQYGKGPTLWAASTKTIVPDVTFQSQPSAPLTSPSPVEIKAPAPISQTAAGSDEIKTYVLSVVSEKTGYPVEVLDLDLDLEADLGIDTVKQAELFAAIRGQYNIARREDLRLSDYNTLAKVIRFVEEALQPASGEAAPQPAAAPVMETVTPLVPVSHNTEAIKTYVLKVVSEKTGYPVEVLDLDLDLEADLGIDTVKQAELFASIRGQYNIPRREDLRLSDYNTLAKVIAFVQAALESGANSPVSQPSTAANEPVIAPIPAPAPSPSLLLHVNSDEIKTYVLSAVSEKTGYPTEVLDLDLDLEADLGIDTVKQAELFAAIRGKYNIARREDLRLSDYNTLAKVIRFVEEALNPSPVASAPPEVKVPVPVPPVELVVPEPPDSTDSLDATPAEIKVYVLGIVSEKTGYPTDVLDLNLDLEADLGIDTVKQAELFAAIRGQYGIPRREDLRLSDYNTLAKVIAFVEMELKKRKSALMKAAIPVPATAVSVDLNLQPAQNSIIRRVPKPYLRPQLDLCVPTQVELSEGKRVLVVESKARIAEPLSRRLAARKIEVLRLNSGVGSAEQMDKISKWLETGPIAGVYFLPALEIEPKLAEMSAADWQKGLEERLYSLYTVMKALPEETFLICATRLGGLHGYSQEGASAPLGGAVSGFAKSVAREREKAFVKVVDFEASATAATIAARLIEETLRDPGALEIGWENDLRYGIATVEESRPAANDFNLEKGSVFLISGGSGGIIRPIVEDLVKATQGTFYLLDRAPLPPKDDPDVARLAGDREGLKNDLIARLTKDGKKPTPVQVEGALFGIERSATTLQTLQNIEGMGGKAHYLACDVTNPALIDEAIQKIKAC